MDNKIDMSKLERKGDAIQAELIVSAWQDALSQLVKLSELSEAQVIDAAAKGGLWRKKVGMHKLRRLRDLNSDISLGDELYLNFDAQVLSQQALTPVLVSDEKNYSVWNKPAGMLSQGSKWSDHCTITETVKQIHDKPTHLVHRLDKAASGLIVLGHTKNAVQKLSTLFAERQIEKHYTVRVHGKFAQAIPARLEALVDEKPAVTEVLNSDYNEQDNTSELLVSILTGRKHQIRSHLHGIDLPVVGDRLFDKEREHSCDLALTASRLAFVCPFTGNKKEFTLEQK